MARVAKWEITPPPDGLLLVDKESNMTSHDLVARARHVLKTKKIGHCGTLDPMATGLLMLVVGKATKLQDKLMADQKEYLATMLLGQTTGSQDKESDVVEEKEVPADLSLEQVQQAFDSYKGDFEQIPPMVSAIKVNGVRLYKLARKGKEIERKPRPVHVFESEISRFESPEIDFRVVCSKGFYVRTYAHDIGQKIGPGSHLTALRRTRSGQFTTEQAITFAEMKETERDDLIARMIPLEEIHAMLEASE